MLMLGCVCRQIPEVVAKYDPSLVGIVASRAQVGIGDAPGYSGWSARRLHDALPLHQVWRDHAKEAPWIEPEFDGIMLDTDDPEAYRTTMTCEIGGGEDPYVDLDARLELAAEADLDWTLVSTWLGTCLNRGINELDRDVARERVNDVAAFHTIRAHNCDHLSMADLGFLRGLGVEQFNFAPEVGLVATMAMIKATGNCNAWYDATITHGGYKRWHDEDWRYGAHYVMPKWTKDGDATIVRALTKWIDERLEATR